MHSNGLITLTRGFLSSRRSLAILPDPPSQHLSNERSVAMTEVTNLSDVHFGRLDAENDPKLLDYFLVTGTVREVAEGVQLVLGRKGSGKTALFTHLAANLPGAVVQMDLNDYVFEMHRGFVQLGLMPDRAYTASWKLLIYSAMFAVVRDQIPKELRTEGDEALNSLGIGKNSRPVTAMLDWLRRVRKIELPSVEGIASAGAFEMEGAQESPLSVDTITAIGTLESVLVQTSSESRVTVLLDRLDDAFDGSRDSLHFITGALRATRDIAIVFGQPQPAPVITFLRTDLWERISFNDRNKMSQDMVYLDWDDAGLIDIVDRRIKQSIGTPTGTGWDAVFTTDEMRNRASAKTYILKRAMGRPRDVIAFADFAKKEALKKGQTIIRADDIYEAEKRYSNHMLAELRDEIEGHVKDFTAVINTLKALGKRSFTNSEWTRVAAANGITEAESVNVLEQLFEASAVGVKKVGGATGGSSTRYRYQDRYLRAQDETLQVHLSLVRELALKDS